MKIITLTGLRNEVDMRTGQPTSFGLIFNEGELHIPVSQETMKQVVAYAFGDEGAAAESQDQGPPPAPSSEVEEVPAEDDIPQL